MSSTTTTVTTTGGPCWTQTDSPIGPLRVVARDGAVTAIDFHPFSTPAAGLPLGERADDDPVLREAVAQFGAYFARELEEFDLPLAPVGSDFQHRVWAQLRRIGYGETASYGEVAVAMGLTPVASRAVGLANARNPLPVVVPCHRVIGADGTLTGYAGGLERKRTLLDLERQALRADEQLF
jgi:methylated-DNA-[protein]-cysteine S-methyltransferase